MKRILLSIVAIILVSSGAFAQKTSGTVVANTLKERIQLTGYAQTGYTYDDKEESSTFDVKRIIFMAEGQITDRWLCYFMYTLGGSASLTEIYTEYKFLRGLTARVGQFKTPYTYENLLSPTSVELINCYSLPTNYLAGVDNSDKLFGGMGGRDMGLMIYGDLCNKMLNYKLAIMNGQGINMKDRNKDKDIVGSVMVNPLKWLSVGGSFIKGKGNALVASSANPDIAAGEDYTRNRWAASAVIETSPLSLRTEYLGGKDKNAKNEGFYAIASYHILPKTIDLIASYDYFNRNKTLDDKQANYIVGAQYWFYPRCRVQLQYTFRDEYTKGSSNLIQAQMQVRF
ncbi:hypothetical protein EZS27_000322 [termite gut metagenome]|uniref:Phosphate-selective porin O and P n=1 Tax=termite gut metagenome TaxID=433724 RepID=A0A5J4T377_9ZZZZ